MDPDAPVMAKTNGNCWVILNLTKRDYLVLVVPEVAQGAQYFVPAQVVR